jgi:Uma2 family endonuclease
LTFITPAQYLELERKAERKSEYYAGEMFALACAGEFHNLVVANIIAALYPQLLPRRCRVYPSDMRVRVTATGLYAYPDVIALCGEPHFADQLMDPLLNPNLIVEVLSPSTEAYDRGRKFEHYTMIESLREYLLVASDRVHADLYTRQADGWLLAAAGKPEDTIELRSVGGRLALSDVYAMIDFAATRA